MNTFEILLLLAGTLVGGSGVAALWHALALRRKLS